MLINSEVKLFPKIRKGSYLWHSAQYLTKPLTLKGKSLLIVFRDLRRLDWIYEFLIPGRGIAESIRVRKACS